MLLTLLPPGWHQSSQAPPTARHTRLILEYHPDYSRYGRVYVKDSGESLTVGQTGFLPHATDEPADRSLRIIQWSAMSTHMLVQRPQACATLRPHGGVPEVS